MKINIIILIIALVSISCKHTTFLEDTFEHVQDVDLIELADFHTDSIGAPIFIYTSKDNVILIEPQMAHLISTYNISNKKYEKFLLKGKGPNESLDIQQIGQAENDSLFFVMDTYTKKVFVYSLQDTSHSIHHQIDIPDLTTSFCCDSNLIIGTLSGDDKRFYIKSSEIIRYFGSAIPVLDYPTSITSQVLGGFCCNSSKRKNNPYKILRLHEKVKAIHYDQEKDVIYAIGCDSKGPKVLFIDCKSIL